MMSRSRAFSAVLALSFLATPTSSVAQTPAPKWSAVEQAVGSENYVEAKKLSDAVLQRGAPEDRQKVMLVYGRILLALGQKAEARQCLKELSRLGVGDELIVIYGAWLRALDKPDEGIAILEKMLARAGGTPEVAAAEAADVLAMLYMGQGEMDKAKKAVDFGLKTLAYRDVKSGYVLALLRGRLNSDIMAGEAKRLYNEAQKLRAAKKFVEAGQLFAQVRARFPKNEWGHASGVRIGQCYVGLGRAAQAIDWWQKFIKESPAGPWRGQAYVELVDVTLESQLDLAKATERALAASKGLSQFSRSENGTVPLSPAEASWNEAAYDIHLRQGIVSLADGRFDAAVDALQQAKRAIPKGTSREVQGGLDRLIESAQQKAKLVPDEVTVGDDHATTALVLGNIYYVLHQ